MSPPGQAIPQQTQQGVLRFYFILALGGSITPHRPRAQSHETFPTSETICEFQGVTSASDQRAINQGLVAASLGSFHLLGLVMELQETLYLGSPTYYTGHYKGYRSRARWRRGAGASGPRARELPCPFPVHHPPGTCTSSTRKLSEHSPFGFLWKLLYQAPLITSLSIADPLDLQLLTPPKRLGGGAGSPRPLILLWSLR